MDYAQTFALVGTGLGVVVAIWRLVSVSVAQMEKNLESSNRRNDQQIMKIEHRLDSQMKRIDQMYSIIMDMLKKER